MFSGGDAQECEGLASKFRDRGQMDVPNVTVGDPRATDALEQYIEERCASVQARCLVPKGIALEPHVRLRAWRGFVFD